jgi:hypothetical protein
VGEELDERTWKAALSVMPPVHWRSVDGVLIGVASKNGVTAIYTRRNGRFYLDAGEGSPPVDDVVRMVRTGCRKIPT